MILNVYEYGTKYRRSTVHYIAYMKAIQYSTFALVECDLTSLWSAMQYSIYMYCTSKEIDLQL